MSALRLSAVFLALGRSADHVDLRNKMVGKPGGPRVSFGSVLAKRVHSGSTRLATRCVGSGKGAKLLFKIGTGPLCNNHNGKGKVTLALVPRRPIVTFRGFHFRRRRG